MEDSGVIIVHQGTSLKEQELYSRILNNTPVITLDVEGVNLGRNGITSIVQIGISETNCFVFDVYQLAASHPVISLLRSVLENEKIVKVIHDCRMDADCLWHRYKTKLTNVHDTSCWHNVILKNSSVCSSLNDTLAFYGIQSNGHRDPSIYQREPEYWLNRPFTHSMINWAVTDVYRLFALYREQVSRATYLDRILASQQSVLFTTYAKTMQATKVRVKPQTNIGKMIGRQGSNLFRLRGRFHFLLYSFGDRSQGEFTLYYRDVNTLHQILSLLPITVMPRLCQESVERNKALLYKHCTILYQINEY
jgi:hypothetical protein